MSDLDIDESFAFQTSSPQSLRQRRLSHQNDSAHKYSFSHSPYEETTDAAPSTDEDEHLPLSYEHDLLRSTSTRLSSVSSFPASVIHHTPTFDGPRTPSKSAYNYDHDQTFNSAYNSPRAHSTGFRHPSSVRALQMRDEYDQSESDRLNRNIRRGSRPSCFSYRPSGSVQSSPSKRLSRSSNTSPQKSKTKLRKEFPLVLLHCTLLPPNLSLRAPHLNDTLLEAIIPQPYGRRWKALQEKVVRNTEVKCRGVLIPHPREEYELLEEKLLESLELERPRLRDGHFLGFDIKDNAFDSGFESASSSEQHIEDLSKDTEDFVHDACPDCGKSVSMDTEAERKWEIKVFAANGLLKSSAWGAVWQEMEKVDVEVNVWMPESVRREVDARLEALLEQEKVDKKVKRRVRKQVDEERMREIYGSELPQPQNADQTRTQDEIDGLFNNTKSDIGGSPNVEQSAREASSPTDHSHGDRSSHIYHTQPNAARLVDVPLQDILANYIRLLLQDRRNIAIILLSILVLFYGIATPSTAIQTPINEQKGNDSLPIVPEVLQVTTEATSISTSPSTSINTVVVTETSTIYEDANTLPTILSNIIPSTFSSENLSRGVIDEESMSNSDDSVEDLQIQPDTPESFTSYESNDASEEDTSIDLDANLSCVTENKINPATLEDIEFILDSGIEFLNTGAVELLDTENALPVPTEYDVEIDDTTSVEKENNPISIHLETEYEKEMDMLDDVKGENHEEL